MVLCMDTDITLPRHLRMRLSNTNHSISCATFAPVTPLRLYHKNINGNTSHCEAHGICTSKQKLFRSATKAKLRNTVSSLLEDSLVQDAILSIDVGTSGTKAALCFLNRSGHGPVARAKYETSSPGHLQMTQCVDDWSRAAITTSRNVLSSNPDVSIAAIAVTGQMQDLIAVGDDPPFLLRTDAILYSDARVQDIAEELSQRCKTRIDPTSILAKLSLLSEPGECSPGYSLLLGAADYVIYTFAADPKPMVTDPTTVSTTGLTTAPHRNYNVSLLERAGFSQFLPLLPSILERPCVNGHLCESVAAKLGRPDLAGTPLVHAGGDAFSATVGAGCRAKDRGLYIYCGTSGWIGGTTSIGASASRTKDGLFALGHCSDAQAEISLASLSAAGGNVSFACETLLGGIEAREMDRLAMTAPIGANGLVYMPFITGRRCPAPDASAMGALYGLKGSSTRADVARAVIEGIAFAYSAAAPLLPEQIIGRGNSLRMVGGGAKSETLVRGVAAMLGGNNGVLRIPYGSEVGILGAAAVAAEVLEVSCGEGLWENCDCTAVCEEERENWLLASERWYRRLQQEDIFSALRDSELDLDTLKNRWYASISAKTDK